MSSNDSDPYYNSPLFHEAMNLFQVGKWDEGFAKLSEVEKENPMELELRSLRQTMEVRARISEYESEENRQRKLHNIAKYSLRTVSIIGILLIFLFAVTTYSGWIQNQVARAQSEFSESMQQAELTIEFRNAQQLISAGKSDEARPVQCFFVSKKDINNVLATQKL